MSPKKLRMKDGPSMGHTPRQIKIFKVYADLGPGRTAGSLSKILRDTSVATPASTLQKWIDRYGWDDLCARVDAMVADNVTNKLAERKTVEITAMEEKIDTLLVAGFKMMERMISEDGELLLNPSDPIRDIDRLMNLKLKAAQYRDKKASDEPREAADRSVTIQVLNLIAENLQEEKGSGMPAVNLRKVAAALPDSPSPANVIDVKPPAKARPPRNPRGKSREAG